MLVKKQRSQKNVLIAGLLVAVCLVVAYFVYGFIINNFVYDIDLADGNQIEQTRINEDVFDNQSFVTLDEKTAQFSASQNIGQAVAEKLPQEVYLEVLDPGTGTTLELFWEPAQEINGLNYQIYRSTNDKDYEVIAGPVADRQYQDNSVETNKKYYYQVAAVAGEKGVFSQKVVISAEDNLAPATPTNISTTYDQEKKAILLTWEVAADLDFSHVNIYRSTKLGDLGSLLTKVISDNNYLDKDVIEGTSYYYTLTAVDQHGNESTKSLLQIASGRNNPFEMFSF